VNPLSALYGAGVGLRNRLYDSGTLRAHQLRGPVISVGSISAGGAGKTPFLIMVGELLKQRDIAFDVLSRGYGRKSKGVKLVDSAGSPEDYGDEPLLIARKLGVPVIVGEDRYAAGQFAEQKFGPQTHLLDDGFQHRRLARDFDIALVTQHDLNDALLPSGRLREPLSSLTRASALAFIHDRSAADVPGAGDCHQWRVLRGIVPPETTDSCFAFCGIARPTNFFTELGAARARVVGTQAFRDHHLYTATDVELLFKLGQEAGATAFLTTEKDAVNLGDYAERLRPLHVVPVRMVFETLLCEVSPVDVICAALERRAQLTVRE
jgi:tetraacyldisaccharide 4'-kinase